MDFQTRMTPRRHARLALTGRRTSDSGITFTGEKEKYSHRGEPAVASPELAAILKPHGY
jgi:hypothetical protein